MAYIYKDYQLVLGQLIKNKINERKHLLWQKGGVPCIDADMWDKIKGKVKGIRIMTDRGRLFKCQTFVFERHREEVNFGFDRQYVMSKDYWMIINLHGKEKSKETSAEKVAKDFSGEIVKNDK